MPDTFVSTHTGIPIEFLAPVQGVADSALLVIEEFDTDAGTQPGHFVILNGPRTVTKITTNAAATIPNGIFGVVYSKLSSTKAEVLFQGSKSGYSGLTTGEAVFVSPSGTPTHTPPTTGTVQQIGFATKPTEIFVQLLLPMRRR